MNKEEKYMPDGYFKDLEPIPNPRRIPIGEHILNTIYCKSGRYKIDRLKELERKSRLNNICWEDADD